MSETALSEREYLLDLLKAAMRANGIIGPGRYARAGDFLGRRVLSYNALTNDEIRELTEYLDAVAGRK